MKASKLLKEIPKESVYVALIAIALISVAVLVAWNLFGGSVGFVSVSGSTGLTGSYDEFITAMETEMLKVEQPLWLKYSGKTVLVVYDYKTKKYLDIVKSGFNHSEYRVVALNELDLSSEDLNLIKSVVFTYTGPKFSKPVVLVIGPPVLYVATSANVSPPSYMLIPMYSKYHPVNFFRDNEFAVAFVVKKMDNATEKAINEVFDEYLADGLPMEVLYNTHLYGFSHAVYLIETGVRELGAVPEMYEDGYAVIREGDAIKVLSLKDGVKYLKENLEKFKEKYGALIVEEGMGGNQSANVAPEEQANYSSVEEFLKMKFGDSPAVLYFYLETCHYCQNTTPYISELEGKFGDSISFEYVDLMNVTEDYKDLVRMAEINAVPYVIVWDGTNYTKFVGEDEIKKELEPKLLEILGEQ